MHARWKDLLQTCVIVGIAATPAWFLPTSWSIAWQLAVLALGVPAAVLTLRHAPFVPTPRSDIGRVLEALELQPGERFCDLGAGDGRMVLAARSTGADCTGIEGAPHLAALAATRLWLQGDVGTRVVWSDLYRADLSEFDALYVWGTAYSVGTDRFADHLLRAAKPGARVVSYHTAIPGLELESCDRTGTRPIYGYRMPCRGEGRRLSS